jgi:arylsulfatase A-like enzyme
VLKTIRRSDVILLLLVFFALLSAACGRPRGDERPNILLISLDTLRADRLHCYGNPKAVSPAMDALAAEGVLFEKVYAQSCWTLPSHVSLFSSLYPSRHGVIDREKKIARETLLLAEILKQAGYTTASFNAGGSVSAKYGFDRGFDLYHEIPITGGSVEDLCDRFIGWLEAHRDGRFFVFFHTYQVHRPYSPPERYKKDYVPFDQEVPARLKDVFMKIIGGGHLTERDFEFLIALVERHVTDDFLNEFIALYDEHAAGPDAGDLMPRKAFMKELGGIRRRVDALRPGMYAYWREAGEKSLGYTYLMNLYDAEIRFTDDQLARMLAALDRLGLKERTLIILTSDHGDEFAEHGGMGHGISCYDEIIRAPLIFRYPAALPRGLRIEENTALIDVPPTILDLAGLEAPPHFQGLSLLPLLRGDPIGARPLFSEHLYSRKVPDYKPVAVIDGRWKYHYDAEKKRPGELYDLESDPGETENLAEERPGVARRLKAVAEAHLTEKPMAEAESIGPDQALEQQLRDLGYIE